MKGDFTRDSFDLTKDFTRVMMQQGRPPLDADWNEQIAIFWEFWRNFTADVLGPHAGPERSCGFGILAEGNFPLPKDAGVSEEEQERLERMLQSSSDFLIGEGHYYVDGLRCTNPEPTTYCRQRGLPHCPPLENDHRPYLIYLDVWERHISDVEDDAIREVALIGTDTCSRAKLVWQVRAFEIREEDRAELKKVDCGWVSEEWSELVHHWQAKHRGRMRARARQGSETPSVEPSVVSPASNYRGLGNQLYRVEIHQGGALSSGKTPTFKYSRENGSVIFPVLNVVGPAITLTDLGRDAASGLQVGDWVELLDDDYILQGKAEPLMQIEKVDHGKMQVVLSGPGSKVDPDKHPLLRRWDQKWGDPKRGGLELLEGAAVIREVEDDKFWLNLENGLKIQFRKPEHPAHYRTGDYWLIPARVATGDIVWPVRDGHPEAVGPHGVQHHYAPLAIVEFNRQGALQASSDCRRKFQLQTSY